MDKKTRHKRPLSERFWEKAQYSPGCWEWMRHKTTRGYGTFWMNNTNHRASRVAYELSLGPIPEGMVVRHKCDNPPCVNPDHLEAGTQLDNVRDRDERGRNGNVKKTHCPKGHEYTPENTRVCNGSRFCRACDAAYQRRKRAYQLSK